MQRDLHEETEQLLARARIVRNIITRGEFECVGDRIGELQENESICKLLRDEDSDYEEDSDCEKAEHKSKDDAGAYRTFLRSLRSEKIVCKELYILPPGSHILIAGKNVTGEIPTKLAKELYEAGRPATYGDLAAQETKMDPTVRRAVYYPLEKLDVHFDPLHPFSSSDKKQDQNAWSALYDVFGKNIRAELTKANIYGPGDFFAAHTDHIPSDSNVVGSIVAILNSEFTGGDLLVRENCVSGLELSKLCDKCIRAPSYYQSLLLVAFPGYCLHEVLPVGSGYRVSLTWNIVKTEECDQQQSAPPSLPPVAHKLHGIVLDNLYGIGVLDRLGPSALLASDRRLYEYFLKQNIPVRLISIGYKLAASWPYDSKDINCDRCWVYEIVPDRWKRILDASAAEIDDAVLENTVESKVRFQKNKDKLIPFYWMSAAPNSRSSFKQEEAIAYTGNESEPGSLLAVYLGAAIIVGHPPPDHQSAHQSSEGAAVCAGKKRKHTNDCEASPK